MTGWDIIIRIGFQDLEWNIASIMERWNKATAAMVEAFKEKVSPNNPSCKLWNKAQMEELKEAGAGNDGNDGNDD